jgi:hypothetical protein
MILLLLGLLPMLAAAADYAAGPEDYRSLLGRLKAGDRLLLAPGDYTRGLPLHNLEGEADRPIVVEGPAAGPPARFLARPGAHTVSLVNVRHLVIRNLELDGRGLAVDAVKAEGHSRYAHFVTLENLYIHGHDATQQNVGISTKCPAHGWVVRGNRIERVGTGMYFGNSDGSAPFVAGHIEGNTVRHSLGYSLQIKHQRPRPADMPGQGQRHETVIRRNLFDKSSGGSSGALARPNVLVGHWPLTGEGVQDRYLIHANLFWQNPTEALFQGEGNLALYNNLFVNHHGPAVRIQPHNDVPRRVDVFHNTVLARDEGIAVRRREGQTEGPQRVYNNLVLAGRPLVGADPRLNHVGGLNEATRWLLRPSDQLAQLDLAPRVALTCDAALSGGVPDEYAEARLDYNGLLRAGCEFGACTRGPCPSPERTDMATATSKF